MTWKKTKHLQKNERQAKIENGIVINLQLRLGHNPETGWKTMSIVVLLLLLLALIIFITGLSALILAVIAFTRTSRNAREISNLKNTVQNIKSR